MKNKLLLLLIISAVIILGISLFYSKDSKIIDKADITKNVSIANKNINVTYYESNMIDEKISYGNILTKVIKVNNTNKDKVNFSVRIKELVTSNQLMTYTVSISKDNVNFSEVINESILSGGNLSYNLTVDENSDLYIKIIFKSKKENEETILKGILQIDENLSMKEVFIVDINRVQNSLLNKINSINGINEKGFYYYEVNTNLKGVVIIDARDISEPHYYYFVHNNDLVIKDIEYTKITPNQISNDTSLINDISVDNACSNVTKNNCLDINTLKRDENGGKTSFHRDAMLIIDQIMNIKNESKNVIIYDVSTDISNSTNIRGYILADYNESEPVYYLYLTNSLFMISGYNLTKNGLFTSDSTTIRVYNETAFNLSSENKNKVCAFSGYSNCISVNGEKV